VGAESSDADDSSSFRQWKRVKESGCDVIPEVGMCVSINYDVGDGKSESSNGVICEVVRDENTTVGYDLAVAFEEEEYVERDVQYPDDMNNGAGLRFIYAGDGVKTQSIPENWQSWTHSHSEDEESSDEDSSDETTCMYTICLSQRCVCIVFQTHTPFSF